MTKITVGDRQAPRGHDLPDCDEEHDDVMKTVMNKMTIRVGVMLLGCIGVVTTIMLGIAGSQVTEHQAQEHQSLLPQPEIEKKLDATEQRLEKHIDEVKADLSQDIQNIQEGQVRMEQKIDRMMETLVTHDRDASP